MHFVKPLKSNFFWCYKWTI